MTVRWMLAALALGAAPTPASAAQNRERAVIIASKPFGESYLLAEMFAQLLEQHGIRVQRRPGLGATEIAFRALRSGAIDVYPEYTGTGLLAVLGEPPRPGRDAREVFDHVAREFQRRFDVRWLPPLGFENTYAISVRRATADSFALRTLSDLARVSQNMRAGFTPDFIGRPDGLPGLTSAYGIRPRAVRSLVPAVKYQALAEGAVDVVDGYSTDGLIKRYDLVVLRDDKAFFPPYEAAALVFGGLARDVPRAVSALTLLSGRIDVTRMRAFNERIEVAGEAASTVARDALRELGLTPDVRTAVDTASGRTRQPSLASYLLARRAEIARMTARHLLLVLISLAAGVILAVPLGLALERAPRRAEGIIRGIGLLQTIPSIALLAFMLPALGIGVIPALVALFLYSLYPIVRNTYSGVRNADPAAVAAATALGMTGGQVLRYVRLPLAAPVIMAGIRTAGVIAVGTATLAAFIGAGGLGDPIVAGLALSDTRMILSGALPAAALALLVDGALALAERAATPAR
jgi:osmoprotectant transport system permease protein